MPTPPYPVNRGRNLGVTLSVLPQVLLLVLLVLGLVLQGEENRAYLALLVFPELTIVPVSVLVGLVCLPFAEARPFGKGVLGGSLLSSAAFVLFCLAATS